MSRGYLSHGLYVLVGKCPGGKCPWGKCPGGTCPGGYVLEPWGRMLKYIQKEAILGYFVGDMH